MIVAAGVVESCRLMIVHTFGKIAMQEHVLDVELIHQPLVSSSEMRHRAYCRRLDHQRDCLMEVDAWSLREPVDNPPRFTPFECPIGVELVFEQPLPGDDIGVS